MSKPRFFKSLLLAFLLVLLPALALGENGLANRLSPKGPIVITSKTLSADSKTNTAQFEGSVVAKGEAMTLYSDKMKVLYSPDGNIERIDADGKVKLVTENGAVTSEKAVYTADDRRLVFTVNPRAVEGPNVITGTKMIYILEEERFIVEDSRVIIKQPTPSEQAK